MHTAVARGLDGQMSGDAWSPDLNNMREGERNATNGLCKPAQPETLMICTMQVFPPLLHSLSLAKTICRLPITGKLHYTQAWIGVAQPTNHTPYI
jgi:hypothetical protein